MDGQVQEFVDQVQHGLLVNYQNKMEILSKLSGLIKLVKDGVSSRLGNVADPINDLDLVNKKTIDSFSFSPLILNGLDYGIVADGITDNTVAFNNFMAACKAGPVRGELPKGTIRLASKPNNIDFNWNLSGKGILSTIILRDYAEGTSTNGCLNIVPNCSGATFQNFSIYASASSSGGALISAISSAGYAISALVFKNLMLKTYGTNTHVYSLFLDGILKTTGATGLRDTYLENVHVYGSSSYSAFLRSVIGFSWEGGGVYSTGGTGNSGGILIGGAAGVRSEYVNIDITRCNGFNLTQCLQMVIESSGIGSLAGLSVNNAGTCSFTQVLGKPAGTIGANWVNSGIRRPSSGWSAT